MILKLKKEVLEKILKIKICDNLFNPLKSEGKKHPKENLRTLVTQSLRTLKNYDTKLRINT